MTNSAPNLAFAMPQMPLDCSDTIARVLGADAPGSDHDRLEHGRAIYRRVRMQLAKEIIVHNWKVRVRELANPSPDGLAGVSVKAVRR